MKKIISIITLTFLSINSLFSQDCPSLNFESEITEYFAYINYYNRFRWRCIECRG